MTIRKLGNQKFRLLSKSGKKLGDFRSRTAAEKRERQIQRAKHARKKR